MPALAKKCIEGAGTDLSSGKAAMRGQSFDETRIMTSMTAPVPALYKMPALLASGCRS